MEISADDIYVSGYVSLPEEIDVDSGYLPDEVPEEAAYILTEAVFGTDLQDIGKEIGTSVPSISNTLEDMKDMGLVDYPDKRRGKDYTPTENGRKVIKSFQMAQNAPEAVIEPESPELTGLERRMEFGGKHHDKASYSAGTEIAVYLSALHNDYTVQDAEEELGLEGNKVVDIRENLEPLIVDEGKYTADYKSTPLGNHVLTQLAVQHLTPPDIPEDQEAEGIP